MSEAVARIVLLERRVMWRTRLFLLQDSLALAAMISGLVAAGFVVITRLRAITMPVWAVVIGTLSLLFGIALVRWFLTRAEQRDAAFLIDESLKLDDRIATSSLIIKRGGPTSAIEQALIEDAAARLGNQNEAAIVPFRTRRWYPLVLVSAVALGAAIMIPPRSLPVDEASAAAERADISTAGEHLERTATEIEQSIPAGTETATLAKEQAEIGRGFRHASGSRAEALRRLSALEERIRLRHNHLSNTRAEEIVSLADRRIRDVLPKLSTARHTEDKPDDSSTAILADEPAVAAKERGAKEAPVMTPNGNVRVPKSQTENARQADARGSRAQPTVNAPSNDASTNATKKADPQKRPQEPVSGQGNRKSDLAKPTGSDPGASSNTRVPQEKPSESLAGDPKAGSERLAGQQIDRKAEEQQKGELPSSLEALKAVPDSLTQQAAKALPNLSEELLKKAAELRANELRPGDIEKLRKAAEFLARDLEQIGQSKELQKALQEMARQVRPEQIEQVARELSNQEDLKRELEAAGRLLSENRQAKEMVAGLAGRFARVQDQRQQRDNQRGRESGDERGGAGEEASRNHRDNGGGVPEKLETADRRLTREGRESSLKGKLRQREGGEYLYLQTKAGVGASRAPYSSAYPQYRRAAERSVQRSQVPPGLRSVVRKYFDAINPDAKR